MALIEEPTETELEIDLDEFDPEPSEYSPSDSFMSRRKNDLKGIFTGDVIQVCFNGDAEFAENDCILLIGELNESYFGLIVDPEEKIVVDGHVLQVNPVQARMSDQWTYEAIERMQAVAKQHTGKVWNSYIDPKIGNKERWVPEREH